MVVVQPATAAVDGVVGVVAEAVEPAGVGVGVATTGGEGAHTTPHHHLRRVRPPRPPLPLLHRHSLLQRQEGEPCHGWLAAG